MTKRLTALLGIPIVALAVVCRGGTSSVAQPDERMHSSAGFVYPGTTWTSSDPNALGWSTSALSDAASLAAELDTGSLMVVHRGHLILSWGDVAQRNTIQSMRKVLLGSLIGIAVGRGEISLDSTLGNLGIDDDPPLSEAERQATVADLLRSRSGVFHSSIYEVTSWKKLKSERGTKAPGEYFFYNNWDFNALGTIFTRQTGESIESAFHEWIAVPIGMEDFREKDVVYLTRGSISERMLDNESDHPAYIFSMSTRDLARFGLLYLSHGRWGDRQVVPASWIDASWEPFSAGERIPDSFGFMWWILTDEKILSSYGLTKPIYTAQGSGGHVLFVIPELELVVAHNVPTGGVGLFSQLKRRFFGKAEVSGRDVYRILGLIIRAHPDKRAAPPGS